MNMTYEIGNPPPLTEELKREIEALKAMPDSEIDYTDIPKMTKEDFANMVRNPWYKPKKIPVTIRMDSDVLSWLRSGGKGYQTRANSILKHAMMQALRRS